MLLATRFVGRVLRGLIAGAVVLALVAGLPWALGNFVGWPGPDDVPTRAELEAVLLGPMTATFLLHALACLCWITWAAFTIDVIRCTVHVARNVTVNAARDGVHAAQLAARSGRVRVAGPVHTFAGILVGAVVLAVLGNRPAPAPASLTSSPTTTLGHSAGIVATTPAQHTPPGEMTIQRAHATTRSAADTVSISPDGLVSTGGSTHPESVVVRAPENGVYDSLWRIAERTLGNGARWPEIFELNKDKLQPNGSAFTNPSVIFPGEELTLPSNAIGPTNSPPQDQPQDQPPTRPVPTNTPPPAASPPTSAPPSSAPPSSPATPAPSTQHTPEVPQADNDTHPPPPTRPEPGWRLGPELLVSLGLAAAVSAALVVARRRHNSRYRPGSGDRTQLPVAPVVYQLRLAHLRDTTSDTTQDTEFDHGPEGRSQRISPRSPRPRAHVVGAPKTNKQTNTMTGTGTGPHEWPTLTASVGVRDGREIALDLATACGLGLVGAGARAAARAILVAALTARPTAPPITPSTARHGRPEAAAQRPASPARTSVVVPADDLAGLLGRTATHIAQPAALRVVSDLDEALDMLEAETLSRATARERDPADQTSPALVLVTRPPDHGRQRLQAVLDNGAPFGITGLLLGQWQPGVTCYVRADGTVSATGPGLGESLRGTRVFRLGDNDTAELLTLLQHADPPTPSTPHTTMRANHEVPLPPTPHGAVAAQPATAENNSGDSADHDNVDDDGDDSDGDNGDLATSVELEVTAAVREPHPTDTALEIVSSSRGMPPGARLRPLSVPSQQSGPSQQSATRHRAEDTVKVTDIRHEVPANVPADGAVSGRNHNISSGVSSENGGECGDGVGDESATTGKHRTTATSPDMNPVDQNYTTDAPADTMYRPITIDVLGPLRVRWISGPHTHTSTHAASGASMDSPTGNSASDSMGNDRVGREITGALQPRAQELLVLLALHRDGITREALVSALWAEDPPARPTNALHTALSRLRHAVVAATDGVVTDIARVDNGRYQLDPTTVTVDYWHFADAVAARRAAATKHERIDAYRDVVNSYGGPLAEGLTTEWIEPAREAIRRDAIDAVAALARALVEIDPQQTLDLLEVARAFDPHNELLYRDIMRLQDRLGQHDAVPRTLTLLCTRLAELNEAPSSQARGLAIRLSQRHDRTPDNTPDYTPVNASSDAIGGPPVPAARVASKDNRGHSAAS